MHCVIVFVYFLTHPICFLFFSYFMQYGFLLVWVVFAVIFVGWQADFDDLRDLFRSLMASW